MTSSPFTSPFRILYSQHRIVPEWKFCQAFIDEAEAVRYVADMQLGRARWLDRDGDSWMWMILDADGHHVF